MSRNIFSGLLMTAVISLSLVSCATPPEEPAVEVEKVEKVEVVREDQPAEISAVENFEPFNEAVSEFVDLSKFEGSWLQIAKFDDQAENLGSELWFAVTDLENATKISEAIVADKNWASITDSAPQTAEGQKEQAEREPEKFDPLSINGVITLEDGSSVSVTVSVDENGDVPLAHYFFTVVKPL